VESAVKACPQVLHRKALAPLENRDRIVDMTGVVESSTRTVMFAERLRF
jgi:hypothetical protein